MDILIFLGTLVAVLAGGFLVIRLILHKRSSGRRAKYNSIPVDSRLKQKHTGRPHLRHQTFARKEQTDEIWKSSRLKASESSWQNGSFTANKIDSDAEKTKDSPDKQHRLAMPTVEFVPDEQASRPAASARAATQSSRRR